MSTPKERTAALDAWRSANDAARQAESELYAAWESHARGDGPPPASGLLERVAQLQAAASSKLALALEALGG